MKKIIAVLCFLCVFSLQIRTIHAADEENSLYNDYLSNKLEIGTRISYQGLTNSDSGAKGGTQGEGTFLGTIYALDEVQQSLPLNLYATYFFSQYFGVELGYESIEAETVATSIGYSTIKSDGNVFLGGPTLSLVGRYPNQTRFTPYLSVGVGYFFGDFDEEAHWALGYSDPTVYEALGSPSTTYDGKTREMNIDDEIGLVVAAGCAYQMTDHLSLDLSLSYTAVEADATFIGYVDGIQVLEQDGSFPLDNIALRAGVSFSF